MTGNRRKFTSFFPPLLHAAHLNKLHNPKGCVCVGGGGGFLEILELGRGTQAILEIWVKGVEEVKNLCLTVERV